LNLQRGTRHALDVRVEGVFHQFGDFAALRGVSFSTQAGEFLTLLGPSGSGKTTLLRIIAGLLHPNAGEVYVGGANMTNVPAEKRDMGFVFQSYALFPHLSVFENVGFPLKLRKVGRSDIRQRVHEALEMVQLSGLEGRSIRQLSGGQAQRVAVARAIVFQPRVLLMDEPLGSLDLRLRQHLQVQLRELHRQLGVTTIYVTHDQEEAFTMSDRIAVMHEGTIRQLGRPAEIYRSPTDPFTASFVGDLNRFQGRIASHNGSTFSFLTEDHITIRVQADRDAGSEVVTCGVRPERVRVGRELAADNRYRAVVHSLVFQRSYHRAQLRLNSGRIVTAEIHEDDPGVHEGEEIWVGWNTGDVLVFDVASNASGDSTAGA
jgi:putative spermidine/putrescine transport system ATP-binding protein